MSGKVTEGDALLAERALAWVHGFGRETRGDLRTECEDLTVKLSQAEIFDTTPAVSTTAAETAAGWSSSIYWYVATTNRAFGALAVGEWNPDTNLTASLGDAAVTPFDTGGLLVHPAKYDCGVDNHSDRLDYVLRHVRSVDEWHATIRDSINTSHMTFSDYVSGAPAATKVTENEHAHLTPGATDDGRPWSWEARIAENRFPDLLDEPSRLYWHSGADRLAVLNDLQLRMTANGASADLDRAVELIATKSVISVGNDAHEDLRQALTDRVGV